MAVMRIVDLLRFQTMAKELVTRLTNVLAHLWIFGALFRSDRKTLVQALYEFAYLVVWSVLPFLLGTLILYVTTDSQDKAFLLLARSTYRNGELLVFTMSMLAPILFLVLHDPDQAEKFPHKLPISTLVMLTAITCATLFALQKSNSVKDGEFVLSLSVFLTVLALIFRYLAIVYNRMRLPSLTEGELRADQTGFVERYGRHVGDGTLAVDRPDSAEFAKAFQQHRKEDQ
jgi:hypothetical protein